MKKIPAALLLLMCFFVSFIPAGESSFSLIPGEFFVGDEVKALYTFTSNDAYLSALTENGSFSFSAPALFTAAGFDCDCTNILISKNSNAPQKNTYVLTITFYPYVTGLIDVPPFDLGELISTVYESDASSDDAVQVKASFSAVHIDIPSFSVMPILSRYPSDAIRPPHGPVIIPGTTYVLYGIAALFVLVVGLIIYIFLKFEKLAKKAGALYRFLFMSVNLKKSLREIKKLQKKGSELSPSEFALKIVVILRTFLEKRFFLPFSCACTDELQGLFNERFQETFSSDQHEAVHRLYELFLRCDFIRFSSVQKDAHTLGSDERKRLIQKASELLLFFEKGEVIDA